jgi:hypothetical protein
MKMSQINVAADGMHMAAVGCCPPPLLSAAAAQSALAANILSIKTAAKHSFLMDIEQFENALLHIDVLARSAVAHVVRRLTTADNYRLLTAAHRNVIIQTFTGLTELDCTLGGACDCNGDSDSKDGEYEAVVFPPNIARVAHVY